MADTLSSIIDALQHDDALDTEAHQLQIIRDKLREVAEKR